MKTSIILTLTWGNFSSEVLQSSEPVLVYFRADWCRPCKEITPVVDELADQYGDRIKVGRVNIDEQPGLAGEYGVRSVPTVLLWRQGQMSDQIVGVRSKWELKESLDQVIT